MNESESERLTHGELMAMAMLAQEAAIDLERMDIRTSRKYRELAGKLMRLAEHAPIEPID
jgi:hypothetical protein